MPVFGTHLFKNLTLATIFFTIILTGIVILAQSLRFLEIIIQAGAPASTFFTMVLYAIPRLIEIILPISAFGACVFIYNKMASDSELIIMRNAGCSPMQLAMPAIVLGLILTLVMVLVTNWLAPNFLSKLQNLRSVVRGEYSALIFRPGVFNTLDSGLTIFIRERDHEGALRGITVYDNRPENEYPIVIMAASGQAYSGSDGQKVLVYNGTRQQFDKSRKVLSKLDFKQYSIIIPNPTGNTAKRWKEPNERTLNELLNPDLSDKINRILIKELFVEAHRRLTAPFLSLSFALIGAATFLFGQIRRRGYLKRILTSCFIVTVAQGGYFASVNLAKDHLIGVPLMYGVSLLPIFVVLFLFSSMAENLRLTFVSRRHS